MSIGCGEQLEQSVCYNLQPCGGGNGKGTYGGLAFLPEGVAKTPGRSSVMIYSRTRWFE